jgi:polyhydroxybutyrate depolymerase
MPTLFLSFAALLLGQADALAPGNHARNLTVGELKRSYHVHVPPTYDPKKPTPIVVALHGAAMNGKLMESFSGLSKKSDEAGFAVVYPNGTGGAGIFLTWNAGAFPGKLNSERPDDVAFIGLVLDEVEKIVNVDKKRVFVTGMSNGAMMSYRLAAEAPERFAAIAPVAGTMVLEKPMPKEPMPIIHFHGTLDSLVPFETGKKTNSTMFRFLGVEESLQPWIKGNGCAAKPAVAEVAGDKDKLKIVRKEWTGCQPRGEIVLYVVEGGGHTWPGMSFHAKFLGATTFNISANDLMWEFFQKHARK